MAPARVVVIDDTADTRDLAVEALTLTFGASVAVTGHEPDDYRTLPWPTVGVAVVDLMMSTPGVEILAWLREDHPTVRRLAWTAYPALLGGDRDLAHHLIVKPGLAELEAFVGAMRDD